jgi:hypothetical protein
MPAEPKDKSKTEPPDLDAAAPRDAVSLVVAIGLLALGAGGILSVFSGPLFALVTH